MTFLFVDETKSRGYSMVAAVALHGDLEPYRRTLRPLLLPGQRRLHMKDEADPRRRAIISAIAATGVTGVIYDAGRRYKTEREARAACLGALIADAAQMADPIVVLEQDDSLLSWDRQRLIEFTREHSCQDTVHYRHRRAAEEALLAIPDALAWCWAKGQGSDWRRRIAAMISQVRHV